MKITVYSDNCILKRFYHVISSTWSSYLKKGVQKSNHNLRVKILFFSLKFASLEFFNEDWYIFIIYNQFYRKSCLLVFKYITQRMMSCLRNPSWEECARLNKEDDCGYRKIKQGQEEKELSRTLSSSTRKGGWIEKISLQIRKSRISM